MADAVTVEELVRGCARRLDAAGLHYGHGTDNPLDEALWLTAHALGLSLPLGEAALTRRVGASASARAEALVAQRIATRKPAAYLTGRAWFAGLEFVVDERVLVPRSPFAELLEDGMRRWLEPARVRRVLELGTGSGCIAVAAALAFPKAEVHAVDISAAALAVARQNLERHGLERRVRLFEGDLYAPVSGERYDLIISNPPYVPQAEVRALPPEYGHEPGLGLASGADGLSHPLRIVDGAAARLAGDGWLALEVGLTRRALERARPGVRWRWPRLLRGGEGIGLAARADLAGAAAA